MQLQTFQYSEFDGQPREWRLAPFTLGQVNLLVGKNASGKSRTLNVIGALAQLIAGKRTLPGTDSYRATFNDNGDTLRYHVEFMDQVVVSEQFLSKDKILLERDRDGIGKIYAERVGDMLEFQTPPSQLAVVARRDTIQHPFFEALHAWAKSVFHYQCGTQLGKDRLAAFVSVEGAMSRGKPQEVDPHDANLVVAMYHQGKRDYGNAYESCILEDMKQTGYELEEIGIAPLDSLRVGIPFPGEAKGLHVKEVGLKANTDQGAMSQGMFRALSVIIQVNYALLAAKPSCILIDDIGEGLDFERSRGLLDILMKRVKDSNIQLIMATNDRFVMNHVPLEHWCFVDRDGGNVRIRNYENSKEIFDEFKFTGLSNFDFLQFDYLHERQAAKADEHP